MLRIKHYPTQTQKVDKMIIYEVSFIDNKELSVLNGLRESAYFSNNVKAKSFASKNKSHIRGVIIIRHEISNSKTSVLKFLNRNGIG